MRIYISGTFTSQNRLRPFADNLRALGHTLTSSWLYESARPAQLNTQDWNRALAEKDIAEVFAADCIILDLFGESTTGGRYTEWGIACYPGSLMKRYTVGPVEKTGVFLAMAHRHFPTWDELFAYFAVNHTGR